MEHDNTENTVGISEEVLKELADQANKGGNRYYTNDQRALVLMLELVKSNYSSFLLLRDEDMGRWWGNKLSTAERKIEHRKKLVREYQMKSEVYRKLSPAERKVLGIRKPYLSAEIRGLVEECKE